MKLYSYFRSSASYRVRIALQLKGIPFEYVPVHLVKDGGEQKRPEYLRLNPMGQVPFLQIGPDLGISQSMAILEYLEETHPKPALLPASPHKRALVRQICEMINSGIQPIQNIGVTQQLTQRFGAGERQVAEWNRHWIAKGLEAVEQVIRRSTDGFCVGAEPTLADALLIPQVYNAHRFEVDLSPTPTVARVDARCRELEAFIKADPDHQPDSPSR